jgi:DNA-binding NarL/FixJ family response regulator
MPIRIVIADDHEIFRKGFGLLLKDQKEIKLVGEASNGEELVGLAVKLNPDIIFTDIKMPGMSGIDATKVLTKKVPGMKILALSMFDEEELIVDMLEAGAKGYLLKNVAKKEILEAIKTVNKNQHYYDSQTMGRLTQIIKKRKFDFDKKISQPAFNKKEIQIIKLICKQCSNKEIAAKLKLSIRTIEGYREEILKKMKVKNSVGIALFAVRNKIYSV